MYCAVIFKYQSLLRIKFSNINKTYGKLSFKGRLSHYLSMTFLSKVPMRKSSLHSLADGEQARFSGRSRHGGFLHNIDFAERKQTLRRRHRILTLSTNCPEWSRHRYKRPLSRKSRPGGASCAHRRLLCFSSPLGGPDWSGCTPAAGRHSDERVLESQRGGLVN